MDSPHIYFVLSVMRVLLIKKEDSVAWSKVEKMMDNWEMFSRDLKLVNEMQRVAEFLRAEAKLDWVEEDLYGRSEYSSNTSPRHIKSSLCPCQVRIIR